MTAPKAQTTVARRSTARAGNAVAVVEEVELEPSLREGVVEDYWEQATSPGMADIGHALQMLRLAVARRTAESIADGHADGLIMGAEQIKALVASVVEE